LLRCSNRYWSGIRFKKTIRNDSLKTILFGPFIIEQFFYFSRGQPGKNYRDKGVGLGRAGRGRMRTMRLRQDETRQEIGGVFDRTMLYLSGRG
jgi:hypothetical protein